MKVPKNLKYKVIIPARANSKRLPGKNMRELGGYPLIQFSIDYSLKYFPSGDIWVNSDSQEVIDFAESRGIKTLLRPKYLATDLTSTAEVMQFQLQHFQDNNIACDAFILLQPTNPLRKENLLSTAIKVFEESNRASLAAFSATERKITLIKDGLIKPINYQSGQRSQDIENLYFENGQIYITKTENIELGQIVTSDVYPLISSDICSSVDIDYIEDFQFAEFILKTKVNDEEIFIPD